MTAAVLLMSVTMPSCPGQQAMQEQIDAQKTTQVELMKRLQTDESQLKQIIEAMNQAKTDTTAMGSTVGQLNTTVEQLKVSVQGLEAKLTKPGARGKPQRRH